MASGESPNGNEPVDSPIEATAVFDLLSHEIRCRIVRELALLSSEQWEHSSVPYSALRSAVDVEDGGKFNYHLGELRGVLVERDGEAYRLTPRGREIANLLLSDRISGGGSLEGDAATCSDCGRTRQLTCRDGVVTTTCECRGLWLRTTLPPAVVEGRDAPEIARLANRRAGWLIELTTERCCINCWGRLQTRLPVSLSETSFSLDDVQWETLQPDPADVVYVEFTCQRCRSTVWLPPGALLLRHPAVVAFCFDHGQNVLAVAPYDVQFTRPGYPGVEETGDGLAVTLVCGEEYLRADLDETATVVETERRPVEDTDLPETLVVSD